VFPAVSAEWRDVSFEKLRAEGGWVVTAARRQGRTALVEVHTTTGGVLRVRDPFDGADVKWNRADVRREGRDLVVRLAAGATLRGERR
jgi:alpha-L-fucosidase 2